VDRGRSRGRRQGGGEEPSHRGDPRAPEEGRAEGRRNPRRPRASAAHEERGRVRGAGGARGDRRDGASSSRWRARSRSTGGSTIFGRRAPRPAPKTNAPTPRACSCARTSRSPSASRRWAWRSPRGCSSLRRPHDRSGRWRCSRGEGAALRHRSLGARVRRGVGGRVRARPLRWAHRRLEGRSDRAPPTRSLLLLPSTPVARTRMPPSARRWPTAPTRPSASSRWRGSASTREIKPRRCRSRLASTSIAGARARRRARAFGPTEARCATIRTAATTRGRTSSRRSSGRAGAPADRHRGRAPERRVLGARAGFGVEWHGRRPSGQRGPPALSRARGGGSPTRGHALRSSTAPTYGPCTLGPSKTAMPSWGSRARRRG
jgi:hypothetical protein